MGLWKLETKGIIEEGIFMAPKLYYLKSADTNEEDQTYHAKGIKKKLLNKDIFYKLMNG